MKYALVFTALSFCISAQASTEECALAIDELVAAQEQWKARNKVDSSCQ